jgi:hypothetical protein
MKFSNLDHFVRTGDVFELEGKRKVKNFRTENPPHLSSQTCFNSLHYRARKLQIFSEAFKWKREHVTF